MTDAQLKEVQARIQRFRKEAISLLAYLDRFEREVVRSKPKATERKRRSQGPVQPR